MRITRWTISLFAAALVAAVAGGSTLRAQDDDAAAIEKERARVAAEALEKAVKRGAELWKTKLGKKSCIKCHEDPDKPKLAMNTRSWSYPAYSRRAKRVVTLHQKINEMLKYQCRAKQMEPDSADIAALAAYVTSIRKKAPGKK